LLVHILKGLQHLHSLGITHNDLHAGNIYFSNTVHPTGVGRNPPIGRYQVYIYDYDRSYCNQIGNNGSLVPSLAKFGNCNRNDFHFDIYKVLQSISQTHKEYFFKILQIMTNSQKLTVIQQQSLSTCFTDSWLRYNTNATLFNVANRNRTTMLASSLGWLNANIWVDVFDWLDGFTEDQYIFNIVQFLDSTLLPQGVTVVPNDLFWNFKSKKSAKSTKSPKKSTKSPKKSTKSPKKSTKSPKIKNR
jgi:serine/threonine protein kinase